MSNGIKVRLLLVVVLFSSFAMTFAQDTPFQVEVVVSVARMRWGPGPTFVVQHYANAGHALTVLEVDSTSNPPWTWYNARTPSNVVAWIRADLVRLATGAAAVVPQVHNPTGTYPVAFDNLCNTAIFRPCQDGTDFLLWQAGYWAFDRYDHWEHGGWNLDIVYHQNPCKLNRLCSTKEEWDAGRLEAELLAITATPEATITPFAVEVTVVKEIEIDVVWETLDRATTAKQLLGRSSVDPSPPGELYNPPLEPLRNKISTGSLYGEFRFNRESVTVSCQYWHNARKEPTEFVKSREFSVNIKKLGDELDCKNRNFNDDIDDDDVVSRQWKITVARSYTGRGQIRNVSWKLSATYGVEPNAECVSATTGEFNNTGPCKLNLEDEQDVEEYLSDYIDKARDKGMPTTIVEDFINPTSSMCTGRKSTEEVGDDEITRYEHTCNPPAANDLQHTLTLHYTDDETKDFLPLPG